MNRTESYQRIAERSIEIADAGVAASIPEAAGFHSYHAVESIGGALCSELGIDYDWLRHKAKINQFVSAANRGGLKIKIGHDVAYVSSLISSLRNSMLYPNSQADGSFELPENMIDVKDAKKLVARVKGLINKVKREL